MSTAAHSTVAVVDCRETYQAMGVSLTDIFYDINQLCKNPKLDIDGNSINTELFLGGDMKVCIYIWIVSKIFQDAYKNHIDCSTNHKKKKKSNMKTNR